MEVAGFFCAHQCELLDLQTRRQSYHVTLHMECTKHHGYKGDLRVTPGTCGDVGERAQVILVWVRAPSVGYASYPRKL